MAYLIIPVAVFSSICPFSFTGSRMHPNPRMESSGAAFFIFL